MTPEAFLIELKNYLRIDHGYDDAQLIMLAAAGDMYMTNAGIVIDYGNPLYKLAVSLYVGANYNVRDGAQKMNRFSYMLQGIILQLKTV